LIGFFLAQGLPADRFKVLLDFYPNWLEEPLLMTRLRSSKTAHIWTERIAKGERSKAPVARFCQLIGCSPTSYYQWKRKLAAKPQTSVSLRVLASGPTKDSIEIKLPEAGARREAIGVREQPNSRKTLVRSTAGMQSSRCM